MGKDDIFVINDVPGQLRGQTLKSGKVKYHVKITTEPVFINLDAAQLAGQMAQMVALHLRERVKAITATASTATLKAREVAQKAYAAGKPWALKRYAGGKTGARTPNQSDKLFNDSGRFAESIVARGDKNGNFRVNVAANRLSGDASTVSRIWTRLVELVPEFADMNALMSSSDIVAARVKAAREMIKKGPMSDKGVTFGQVLDFAKGLGNLVRNVDELMSA